MRAKELIDFTPKYLTEDDFRLAQTQLDSFEDPADVAQRLHDWEYTYWLEEQRAGAEAERFESIEY